MAEIISNSNRKNISSDRGNDNYHYIVIANDKFSKYGITEDDFGKDRADKSTRKVVAVYQGEKLVAFAIGNEHRAGNDPSKDLYIDLKRIKYADRNAENLHDKNNVTDNFSYITIQLDSSGKIKNKYKDTLIDTVVNHVKQHDDVLKKAGEQHSSSLKYPVVDASDIQRPVVSGKRISLKID